jgi:hypothetical protein
LRKEDQTRNKLQEMLSKTPFMLYPALPAPLKKKKKKAYKGIKELKEKKE